MSYENRILSTATGQGIPQKLALLIVAQSKHETNNYSSNAFKNCNNCFGYKYVGQRLSTGACIKSSEGDFYAKYSTIENSVLEICAWIKRRQKEGRFPADLNEIQTAQDYADYLADCGFYGQSPGAIAIYTAGLLRWFNGNIQPAAGGIGVILIGALCFFLLNKGR